MTTPNPATVYLSRWSAKSDTRKTMHAALNRVADALLGGFNAESYPWHTLRFDTARAIPALLEEDDLEPATINKLLSAVRGVLETAHSLKLISDDDYSQIEIKNVRGSSEGSGRALSDTEVDALLAKLPKLGKRDAAAVAIMIGAGARRVEVVKIKREDYVRELGSPTARISLYGKGRKPRRVPVGGRWQPFIEAYWAMLEPRQLAFPGSRRVISLVVERLAAALGAKFTPHDLRRTFGTHICEVADVAVAQRLLGHSDVKTTLLYDRRGEGAEDDAVKDW
ncbi:MAG TPA: site-specific integrase [Vicinamibacterales bacterium]|nr:site-specific integrase [Vicinamibacterales bacterium]